MATFSYRAIDRAGRSASGSLVADSKELAMRQLRSQNLIVAELSSGSSDSVQKAGKSGKLNADDVLAITRELTVLLRSGLPIDRSLKVMIDMAAKQGESQVLASLLDAVKGGKSLSDALEAHREDFGNFYISMVRSGEASGHMVDVLSKLLQYLENSKMVRSSVTSALVYPAILAFVAILSIVAMLGFVVPQFEALFSDMGDALPAMTRFVIVLGDLLSAYWWLIAIVLAGFVMWFKRWRSSSEGRHRFDEIVLSLPVFGPVVFKYEFAKFSRTTGTLLSNGVALLPAISIAINTVDNVVIRSSLEVLEPAVKRGQRMSIALEETGKFTPMVIQMLRVGEESGSLDSMLSELAQVYDDEVQAGVKRGLTLLEPLLILVMGGVIALVIISILMGIMSVNDLAV